jgi:hypothetical protein
MANDAIHHLHHSSTVKHTIFPHSCTQQSNKNSFFINQMNESNQILPREVTSIPRKIFNPQPISKTATTNGAQQIFSTINHLLYRAPHPMNPHPITSNIKINMVKLTYLYLHASCRNGRLNVSDDLIILTDKKIIPSKKKWVNV